MALTLSPAQPSVAEGGALAFTIGATPGDSQRLFKPLSWVILDAVGEVVASGGDFAAASDKVSPITHGKTTRDFTVTAVADALFEGTETYTVQVRSDSVAGLPLSAGFTHEIVLVDQSPPEGRVLARKRVIV